jgi:hypothetical protein
VKHRQKIKFNLYNANQLKIDNVSNFLGSGIAIWSSRNRDSEKIESVFESKKLYGVFILIFDLVFDYHMFKVQVLQNFDHFTIYKIFFKIFFWSARLNCRLTVSSKLRSLIKPFKSEACCSINTKKILGKNPNFGNLFLVKSIFFYFFGSKPITIF